MALHVIGVVFIRSASNTIQYNLTKRATEGFLWLLSLPVYSSEWHSHSYALEICKKSRVIPNSQALDTIFRNEHDIIRSRVLFQ